MELGEELTGRWRWIGRDAVGLAAAGGAGLAGLGLA
jgi:hypothetical protein